MTNQDAIKILKKMGTKLSEHLTGCMEADVEIVEELDAIDAAIDALEQEKILDKGMNTFDCGEVCCECCSKNVCIYTTADKNDTKTDAENLIIEAAHNTRNRREWFREVQNEIEELAEFHSVDIPVIYGDGEESTDKMVSLEELGQILSVIEDAMEEKS